jgi:hypothetical protein
MRTSFLSWKILRSKGSNPFIPKKFINPEFLLLVQTN